MSLKDLSEKQPERFVKAVVDVLNTKLSEEDGGQQLKRINVPKPNPLELDESLNALLLEFRSSDPKLSKVPSGDISDRYRLLVILSHFHIDEISSVLLSKIRRVSQMSGANRVVVWTIAKIDGMVSQNLKDSKIDVIHVPLPTSDSVRKVLRYFVHVNEFSYGDIYDLNILANRIIKRLRKMFHLVLSELAAATYDQNYGKDNFATKSIMEYEEELLKLTLERARLDGLQDLAVDVGCGTGRHSFILCKSFSRVIGLDFSHNMIEVAKTEKARRIALAKTEKEKSNLSNIEFYEYDFEYEEFPEEMELSGKVDFICASFGMGSFIENTSGMLRRFSNWLKPRGKVILSFYNAKSLPLNVTPNWRDSSLATKINVDKQSLQVNLGRGARIEIFCLPFDDVIMNMIGQILHILETHTYPTTMAILPNSLFSNPIAREVYQKADRLLATDKQCRYGHYVMLIAEKGEGHTPGYDNVLRILNSKNLQYEIMSHSPVLSLKDVSDELRLQPEQMIKTVIFRLKRKKRPKKFIAVVLPNEKKADRVRLAEHYNEPRWAIQLAGEKEIANILGFPLGGVAPFGFSGDIETLIDADVLALTPDSLYMGVGDNTKTLKLKREDFFDIVSSYIRI